MDSLGVDSILGMNLSLTLLIHFLNIIGFHLSCTLIARDPQLVTAAIPGTATGNRDLASFGYDSGFHLDLDLLFLSWVAGIVDQDGISGGNILALFYQIEEGREKNCLSVFTDPQRQYWRFTCVEVLIFARGGRTTRKQTQNFL